MTAEEIMKAEYAGKVRMTPHSLEFGVADSNDEFDLVYEIAHGESDVFGDVYCVLAILYRKADGKTSKHRDNEKLCAGLDEAKEFANELSITNL